MEFAVNYSAAAAKLLQEGRVVVDRFKCPAWPDLITAAQELHPVYVHLPLRVGAGIGEAINTETQQPADWGQLEPLLTQTGTPQVNTHLAPLSYDFPDIPITTTDPAHVEALLAHALRDVQALVDRFGPRRVTLENADDGKGLILHAALQPDFIRRVVEETGCCFLLDIAHARLAAHTLGLDARAYLAHLPLERISEIHLAGIQPFQGIQENYGLGHHAKGACKGEEGVFKLIQMVNRPGQSVFKSGIFKDKRQEAIRFFLVFRLCYVSGKGKLSLNRPGKKTPPVHNTDNSIRDNPACGIGTTFNNFSGIRGFQPLDNPHKF